MIDIDAIEKRAGQYAVGDSADDIELLIAEVRRLHDLEQRISVACALAPAMACAEYRLWKQQQNDNGGE